MKVLVKTSKAIDKVVKTIGIAAGYLSIVIMLLMVFEVFSRRIFHSPTLWSYETVSFLFGAMVMLTLPYGLQLGVNVRVDVLYNKFSLKAKRIIDIVLFIVFFGILMVAFTTAGYKYAIRSVQTLERSWSAWSPLLWPVKVTIPACGTFMLLQGVSELIKMFLALFGHGDLVGISDEEVDKISQEIAEIEAIEAETKAKHHKDVNADENDGGAQK